MQKILHSQLWTYRLLRLLLIIISATITLHLIMQTINFIMYPHSPGMVELSNRFDLDDEQSIPTWISQFLLCVAALLVLIIGRLADGKKRLALYCISVLAFLASIDEVARLHELVLQSVHIKYFGADGAAILRNAWLIVLPFIIIGAALFFKAISRIFPKRTIKILFVAALVFFVGAIGIEVINSGLKPNGWQYTVFMTALEEGLELIGTAILIFAAADYAEQYHQTQIKKLLSAVNIKHSR